MISLLGNSLNDRCNICRKFGSLVLRQIREMWFQSSIVVPLIVAKPQTHDRFWQTIWQVTGGFFKEWCKFHEALYLNCR